MGDKYRVLFVCSHPVQYAAPLFRRMANHPKLDLLVAYCNLQGAQGGLDEDFGVDVAWDVPLLDGYPWVEVKNRATRPGLGRFWGLRNPGVRKLIRDGNFDAVVIFTGYVYATFWMAVLAAKRYRKGLLFGTDAHELQARDSKQWKASVKRLLWPRLFRLADVVIVPSSAGVRLMESIGIPPERIAMTPYTVDNDWWLASAASVDRAAVRRSWNVPHDAPVALFCAKLQPWKRPKDALDAFVRANAAGAYLVYAGDGALRGALEAHAREMGVADRVRFLGFVNQSQLPAVYRASDLMVLPSDYEPFGVVVNEAILCGCCVAVSDRVGAGYDLVRHGESGYIFPVSDVEALAKIFSESLAHPERLRQFNQEAKKRMETWSPEDNIEATVAAIEKAANAHARVPRAISS